MTDYPAPAAALVATLTAAAAAEPHRAVAFQGAPGAYSHQAVREAFPDALPLPCFTFEDAIAAVQAGAADCAVIPIENSLHGRVADIHFLLPESGLAITGEHFVRVRHCLLGVPGAQREGVTTAVSHPQALGQCRKRLRDWGIVAEAYADTAAAAALVAAGGDRRGRRSPAPSRANSTASTCWPRGSRTRRTIRRASSSSPAAASRLRPGRR